MTTEGVLSIVLGGGFLGSVLAWWTTRHKPKVDTTQVVLAGSEGLINNLQEERNRLDERITAVEHRAAEAEARAKEAERNASYLAADMAKITDHHLATVRGVAAGTVPPWLPVPRNQNWLSNDDYPVVITPRHHDTGTPGVDLNPPVSGTDDKD